MNASADYSSQRQDGDGRGPGTGIADPGGRGRFTGGRGRLRLNNPYPNSLQGFLNCFNGSIGGQIK